MKNYLVHILATDEGSSTWVWQGMCLWDAPEYMISKYVLPSALSNKLNPILTAFFKETLTIANVSWYNFLEELEVVKAKGEEVVDNIQDIYCRLQTMSSGLASEDLEKLR